MKIYCIVVDDEPIARQILQNYIAKDERLELVAACSDVQETLKTMQKMPVNLLFMDINMPKISGLEYIKSLRNPPAVIFCTAYREYALDAFNVNALDYLVKPFSFERFLQAVNKAELFIHAQNEGNLPENFFFVKADGKWQKIVFEEIIYIEALKEYVRIVLKTGKPVVTYLSMNLMEEKLSNQLFFRSHRSYIVNLAELKSIEGNVLQMSNGQEIPLSRNEKEALMERIARFKWEK